MLESGQIAAPLIMLVTVATSLLGLYWLPRIIDVCLFRPYHVVRDQQYVTFILSGFVHADLGHLLFNMFTFYFFAFPMEEFIGTIPFLILYFSGLVLSHTCTWYKHRNNPAYASLGAQKINLVLGCDRRDVRLVRSSGVVMMVLGAAVTALVWFAVIAWLVVLYFYE